MFRFARRCSYKSDFDQACSKLFSNLRKQEYPRSLLRNVKCKTIIELGLNGEWNSGFLPCEQIGCLACKYAHFGKTVQAKIPYLIGQRITCQTAYVVYVIFCQLCGIIYVGQTAQQLRTRILSHLGNIKRNSDHPISQHFNKPDHNRDYFSYQGIYRINPVKETEKNTNRLLRTEQRFIEKFETLRPKGENTVQAVPRPIPLILPFSPEIAIFSHTVVLKNIGIPTRTIFKRHSNLADILINKL